MKEKISRIVFILLLNCLQLLSTCAYAFDEGCLFFGDSHFGPVDELKIKIEKEKTSSELVKPIHELVKVFNDVTAEIWSDLANAAGGTADYYTLDEEKKAARSLMFKLSNEGQNTNGIQLKLYGDSEVVPEPTRVIDFQPSALTRKVMTVDDLLLNLNIYLALKPSASDFTEEYKGHNGDAGGLFSKCNKNRSPLQKLLNATASMSQEIMNLFNSLAGIQLAYAGIPFPHNFQGFGVSVGAEGKMPVGVFQVGAGAALKLDFFFKNEPGFFSKNISAPISMSLQLSRSLGVGATAGGMPSASLGYTGTAYVGGSECPVKTSQAGYSNADNYNFITTSLSCGPVELEFGNKWKPIEVGANKGKFPLFADAATATVKPWSITPQDNTFTRIFKKLVSKIADVPAISETLDIAGELFTPIENYIHYLVPKLENIKKASFNFKPPTNVPESFSFYTRAGWGAAKAALKINSCGSISLTYDRLKTPSQTPPAVTGKLNASATFFSYGSNDDDDFIFQTTFWLAAIGGGATAGITANPELGFWTGMAILMVPFVPAISASITCANQVIKAATVGAAMDDYCLNGSPGENSEMMNFSTSVEVKQFTKLVKAKIDANSQSMQAAQQKVVRHLPQSTKARH